MTFDTPSCPARMVRFDRMQSSERIDIDEPNQKNSLDFTRTKSLTMTAPRNKKDGAASSLRRVKGAYTEDDMIALVGSADDDAPTVLYHPVTPSDTLAGLALKYRTTIPELKKLNNIQNDAEVQARQSVKVPIAKYGIFSEQVENLKPPPKKPRDEEAADPPSVDEKLATMMSNIETAVKEVKEKLNEKEELMGGAEVWEEVALAISVPAVAPQSKGFFDSSRFLYYLIAIALLVACIPLLAFLPGFDVHQWLRN